MNDFFKALAENVKEYWMELRGVPPVYWLCLPATLFVIWLLTILLKLILKKSKYPLRTIYTIHRRVAVATAIAGILFLFYLIYCWKSGFYNTHAVRPIHLLCFGLILLISLVSLLILRRYYKKDELKEIAEYPKTKLQLEKINDLARKGFTRIKLMSLLVALGYLGLLIWGLSQDRNLVSIVLDNSYSMDQSIRNGKTALANTFKNLGERTQIVLTTFTAQAVPNPPDTYEKVVASTKFNTVSLNNFFETPTAALPTLDAVQIETSVGSPITQTIWENYQFIKHSCPVQDYKKILLLIITDGADNLGATLDKSNGFFCNDPGFNEVFPAENVRIIDVSDVFGNGNINTDTARGYTGTIQLFAKANKCGYDIQNGKELEDYSQAVDDALKDLKKDWSLIAWTAFLYFIYLIIIFFINPPLRS